MEDDFLAITKHCLGSAPKLADTPDWIYNLDNPYLHGVYAPMLEEFELEDLPVEGEYHKTCRVLIFVMGQILFMTR